MEATESGVASKRAQRPKITLQIPTTPHNPMQRVPPTANSNYYGPPLFTGRVPVTPSSNATNPYYNPFMNMYHSKASDFMFQQFAGFKDFTMNTAKSGLSGGEKTAFWLYNKLSQWSKKWFTHIFLFLCLLGFSLIGAVMFVALESPNEEKQIREYGEEMFKVRGDFAKKLKEMASNSSQLFRDDDEWLGNITAEVREYEKEYSDSKAKHALKDKKTWTFYNAMFYAGTVYTTIGSHTINLIFARNGTEPFVVKTDLHLAGFLNHVRKSLRAVGMSKEEGDQPKKIIIPIIKADSESQTSGHLVVHTPEEETNKEMEGPEASQNISIRKRRNLSKNRAQATRQREKTPEPGRMGVPHEDTTTSDEEDSNRKPRTSREKEAEDNYKEMMRLIQEKSSTKDPDDIDVEEIKEQRAFAEHERRRRSISPFALPSQEEIARLQRKGSFIDPTNKLLSTNYNLSPKEEDTERRNSLTIDTAPTSMKSLSPSTPISGSPREASGFSYPSPPSPRKQTELIYPDEKEKTTQQEKKAITPNKKDPNEIFTFETKDTKHKTVKTPVTIKSEPQQGELVTKVIQVERTPSKKLMQENKPVVEVRPTASVERTPSKKSLSESRPVVVQRLSTKQAKDDQQSRSPPVKPARSKSASRFGGKTSESEMSEDQSRFANDNASNNAKRKNVATPRRFMKNKSPRAKRSQSVTRVEDLMDKTGTGMSQTSKEIIHLLQQARARSLSIPKDDERIPVEYKNENRRNLMTPNKSPATSRRSRGISCPKTIQIISKKEVLSSLTKAQKLDLEFEKSRRSSGYVDASQSEYTSSCYSSSPSENEYEFNLIDKTAELNRKLSLLSQEMRVDKMQINQIPQEVNVKSVLKKRSSSSLKKEHKKEKSKIETQPEAQEEKVKSTLSKYKIFREWSFFKINYKKDYDSIKILCNRCLCDLLILIIFCGIGGMMFKNLEGSFESAFKCGTRNVKRDFIEHLWKGSHYLREEDWKSMARNKLHEFEDQLHTAHEAGVTSYSGQRSWNFMNSFIYCLTVVTTIGYGHIVPSTTSGRLATIFYAVVGIPLFLIVLADFGKLFTRIIKFFWAFIRRVYFTGSCKKVRRTVPMQEMMKGFNIMYDVVRRPSQMLFEGDLAAVRQKAEAASTENELPPNQDDISMAPPKPTQQPAWVVGGPDIEAGTEPETPAPSVFEIDDEFNLPISVAIIILIAYIFVGAAVYKSWEAWSFFESFYFVFISMSTIGFGDYVPGHPIFMMASILYLVFGLALTSMCINVVQVKLTDTFRQASAKLGATIGLRVAEDDGGLVPITPQLGEIAPVHRPNRSEDKDEGSKVDEFKSI